MLDLAWPPYRSSGHSRLSLRPWIAACIAGGGVQSSRSSKKAGSCQKNVLLMCGVSVTTDWPLAKPRMEPHETELLKAGTVETTAAAIPDISKARRNDQNDSISVRQPAEA